MSNEATSAGGRDRIAELLEANNRYLERARAAEAERDVLVERLRAITIFAEWSTPKKPEPAPLGTAATPAEPAPAVFKFSVGDRVQVVANKDGKVSYVGRRGVVVMGDTPFACGAVNVKIDGKKLSLFFDRDELEVVSEPEPAVPPPSSASRSTAAGMSASAPAERCSASTHLKEDSEMSDTQPSAEHVTIKHIARVNALLLMAAAELKRRGEQHDLSKLTPEELGPLQEMQDLINREGQAPFGSAEYKRRTDLLKPMLDHHYARNSHHPEHYPNGVAGMDLFDLIEMFFDWKAASERGEEPAMHISAACERFKIEPMLRSILENTADRLGYKRV